MKVKKEGRKEGGRRWEGKEKVRKKGKENAR